MKKILVPTDFSPHADAALSYALDIAEKLKGEIIMLHVLQTPVNWVKLSKEQERLFPETVNAINHAKTALGERTAQAQTRGLPTVERLSFIQGRDQIMGSIESEEIDLVVMGSHGQYGLKEHVLGSNTYHVLRRSAVPVLVVKSEPAARPLQRLVFATDLKDASGPAFQKIEKLAQVLGLDIQLLYVNTPANFMEDSQIEDLQQAFLERWSTNAYSAVHYSALKEERGIIQYAQKAQADLVAVVTHGRSDLQQLFAPSVTENLVTYLKTPVLSIHIGLE